MYEKHIEALKSLLDGTGCEEERDGSLLAAIALMRAAEPKDETAEREEIECIVHTAMTADDGPREYAENHRVLSDRVARLCAAARAEGYSAALRAAVACTVSENDQLTEARAALKTATDREEYLETERDRRAALITETLGQLADAKERIAELETLLRGSEQATEWHKARWSDCEDRLAALREAAERFADSDGLNCCGMMNAEDWDAFEAAIEASKK